MRERRHRPAGRVATAIGLVLAAQLGWALASPPAAAAPGPPLPAVAVSRVLPTVTVPITTARDGEAVLELTAHAPTASWAVAGRESAVVAVSVDGRYVSDLVVTGPRPIRHGVGLGALSRGRHTVRLTFAADRSAPGVRSAHLRDLHVSVAPGSTETGMVRRHAPILLGRDLAVLGGPTQNARTDTPLLAWHEIVEEPVAGWRRFTYSVIWSNEDGGTDSPGLMARWGRTTDIEWVYSVVVDANGARVPGHAFHQGPNHAKLPFTGHYEGDHPVLRTCTTNNNQCPVTAPPPASPTATVWSTVH